MFHIIIPLVCLSRHKTCAPGILFTHCFFLLFGTLFFLFFRNFLFPAFRNIFFLLFGKPFSGFFGMSKIPLQFNQYHAILNTGKEFKSNSHSKAMRSFLYFMTIEIQKCGFYCVELLAGREPVSHEHETYKPTQGGRTPFLKHHFSI